MNEFRKWLIRKLGGRVPQKHYDDCPDIIFRSKYYVDEYVNSEIFVPKEHYTDANKENIELELVMLLGEELLNRDLLYFYDSWKPDAHGDVRVGCQFHVLKNRDRTGLMPPRLERSKESK